MSRFAAACLLSALSGLSAAEEPIPAEPHERAANFTLANAQDGLTRVKWPREKAVFLTFGEQASQVPIQAWSKRVRDTFGDRIDYVGVAWLESVPPSLLQTAKTVIKTSHPEVLMDTSGSAAKRYNCRAGEVNAFLIAPDGEILLRIHEAMTDEQFAELERRVDPYLTDKRKPNTAKEGNQK